MSANQKGYKIKSGKFKLKKNPKLGNNSKLLKVNSVIDNKRLESNLGKGNNLNRVKQDGFIFHSKNAKKIKRNFFSNFNAEIMSA